VVKPVPRPFVTDRIQSKKKERKKERTPNGSLSTTITAFLNGCSGISSPAPEHSRGYPLASNMYAHILIHSIELGNGGYNIAVWSQVYD
jgi:hypothetical protein